MIHVLGPTGQLILQTLGFTAAVLCFILLVIFPFIVTLQKYHRIFTPRLVYILFLLCIALIIADLLFTNHDARPRGPDG